MVTPAGNTGRVENLTAVLIPTMSKDIDEQPKQAHKVVDLVDRCIFFNSKTDALYFFQFKIMLLRKHKNC